jgi:hypothetical protein
MIFVLAMLAMQSAPLTPSKCRIYEGEVVPTADVARGIAEAILKSRQSIQVRSLFKLRVEPSGPDAWDVTEFIPPHRAADGHLIVTDGGGLSIRIARCDGRIVFIQPLI